MECINFPLEPLDSTVRNDVSQSPSKRKANEAKDKKEMKFELPPIPSVKNH